ncbi:MAG: sulfite exporter TauE/SafE family protein [Saprospiraceae bacterium]
MYYIAFTLGLLSSLHCLGMCGPLALAAQSVFQNDKGKEWLSAVLYNTGRLFSYMFLGLLFGLLGSLFVMTGYQKMLSILSGSVLLLLFLFSMQPDEFIQKIPFLKNSYRRVQSGFTRWIKQYNIVSRFFLGVLNGFLPCGMVYIALAGAISVQNPFGSMGFMLFFGLGTFPAMVGIMLARNYFKLNWRLGLQKIYPIVSLILGLYLIYRGVFSTTPLELNFIEALNNPVMCH